MMPLELVRAEQSHVEDLLRLYFAVYGPSYPLALGCDRQVMQTMIASSDVVWMVARIDGQVVGSAVIEIDSLNRVGKLEGVAVDINYRKQNVAHRLIDAVTNAVLGEEPRANSVYATTRTVSLGPQIMCLANGFLPFGILPNAHKLRAFETLTVMVRYAPHALERRKLLTSVPAPVAKVLSIANETLGVFMPFKVTKSKASAKAAVMPSRGPTGKQNTFEMIDAPNYVERRYKEAFPDPQERFYPFHTPNLLIAAVDGSIEAYAYLSKVDRYCTLLLSQPSFAEWGDRLPELIESLADHGASYLETLVAASDTASIQALTEAQFVPSAAYPAMREIDGQLHDFFVMSRTMQPLNFRGMSIECSFKPYVDQFVDSWKQMYLDTLEVFDDYT